MRQAGDDRGPAAAISNPLRRALLAGGVAGLVAIVTPRQGHAAVGVLDQDGELIRLCEAFVEAHRAGEALQEPYYSSIEGPPDEVMDEERRLVRLGHDLAEQIVWLPAHTADGVRAKAAVVASYISEHPEVEPDSDDPFERVAWSLARTLLRVS